MSVLTEIREHVAVLLLNEPKTRHALSRTLIAGLQAAMDSDEVKRARAIVIGSTGPFFCAGANINDLLNGWMQAAAPETDPVRFFERLAADPRPTIAAVGGGALGGGFELMLSCDLAVATTDAWFCLPELGHGVIPNTALMRLQQMIGLRRTMRFVMTGERIDSPLALELGLLNEVVQDPVASAVHLAGQIVKRASPDALALAKSYAHQHSASEWKAVHQSLIEVPERAWREGLQAFTQKRAAQYDEQWQALAKQRVGHAGLRTDKDTAKDTAKDTDTNTD